MEIKKKPNRVVYFVANEDKNWFFKAQMSTKISLTKLKFFFISAIVETFSILRNEIDHEPRGGHDNFEKNSVGLGTMPYITW